MREKEYQRKTSTNTCSDARDGKDSGIIGPVFSWVMAPTPLNNIPFPSPSCLRRSSQFITTSHHAVLAGDEGCHLLGHPCCWDGTASRFVRVQLPQQQGARGSCFYDLAKHCGGLKCIQKAIGTLSRAQAMAFLLGSGLWKRGAAVLSTSSNLLVIFQNAAYSGSLTL